MIREPVFQTEIDPYGEWVDTNPGFSASADGMWLVEIGPPGFAFRCQDRLSAIVRGSTITARGKFFSFRGEIDNTVSGMTGDIAVVRHAVPWYSNDWTVGADRFEARLSLTWVGINALATGELAREGMRPLGSHWRKLSDPI